MQISFEKHLYNLIAALAVVSYFELFGFSAIPYSIRVVSQPIMFVVMAILIIIRIIYNPRGTMKMNFATPIAILFIRLIPQHVHCSSIIIIKVL